MESTMNLFVELQASKAEGRPPNFECLNLNELNSIKQEIETRMLDFDSSVRRRLLALPKMKADDDFRETFEQACVEAEAAMKHYAVAKELSSQMQSRIENTLVRGLGNSSAAVDFALGFAEVLESNITEPPQASWAFLNGGQELLLERRAEFVERRSLLASVRMNSEDPESNVIVIDFRRK